MAGAERRGCVSHVNCPIMSCWLDSVNQRGPFVHAGLLTCDTDTCRSCQSSTAPEVLMKLHLLTWLDLPGAWIDASVLPPVDSKLARQFNCFISKWYCEVVWLFTLNLIDVSSLSRWTWRFERYLFRAEACTTAVWRATSKRWRNLRKILWVLKMSLYQTKQTCIAWITFIGRFLLHINTRTFTRGLKLGSSTQNPHKVVDISTVVNSEWIFATTTWAKESRPVFFCQMSLFSYS